MDDFLKDLKFHVYDRLRSPVITTFALAWITWNFSTIILLFGKGDFERKILMLGQIYKSRWEYFLNGLIFPMAWATAFILIYPFLARWAFIYWSTQLKATKEEQVKIEDSIPMTLEDIRELKHNFFERSKNQESEIERLQRINQQLKESEKNIEAIINGYLDSAIKKDKELKDKESINLSLVKDLAERDLKIEELTKQLSAFQANTTQTNYESLGSRSASQRLKRFLDELGVNDEGLSETLKNNLMLAKIFMDNYKLNLDELKAIIYLLGANGRAFADDLRAYLRLSKLNLDVVAKRLSNNGYCEVYNNQLTLKSETNLKLYDSKLSKIPEDDLKELINALKVKQ